MKKPIAKFEITSIFRITGRGVVFAGLIKEGVVSKGNCVKINSSSTEYIINAIEFIDGNSQKMNVGLVIAALDSEIETLLNTEPQTANIY